MHREDDFSIAYAVGNQGGMNGSNTSTERTNGMRMSSGVAYVYVRRHFISSLNRLCRCFMFAKGARNAFFKIQVPSSSGPLQQCFAPCL